MINYNTPITDAILQKNGWIRFENTPVYVKKLKNQYMTSFMLDFYNYQQKYEEYFGTIWKDKTDEEKYKGMKFGYEILSECMELSNNIIALMPWFTIVDSDVRLREIYKFGLKSITALPRKTFDYARIQTCILEMDKSFKGDTLFKVFNVNLLKKQK